MGDTIDDSVAVSAGLTSVKERDYAGKITKDDREV